MTSSSVIISVYRSLQFLSVFVLLFVNVSIIFYYFTVKFSIFNQNFHLFNKSMLYQNYTLTSNWNHIKHLESKQQYYVETSDKYQVKFICDKRKSPWHSDISLIFPDHDENYQLISRLGSHPELIWKSCERPGQLYASVVQCSDKKVGVELSETQAHLATIYCTLAYFIIPHSA